MSSISIPVVLFILFLVGAFASGYGFGNWVEATTLKLHEEEIDALNLTIEELYGTLDDVYQAFTGNYVGEEQAAQAAARAEWVLATVMSPEQVEAAARD